ncbi:MAG: NUDIX hydrolase [Pirellulaceae bacterium]|nr:NUDIX hydrolase [Pirellulaceae bacterium]
MYESDRFRIERVEYELDSGQVAARDVIQHPGAAVVIPVLPDGRICLIRNYRVAVDAQLIELPAGTLEPGEPPLQTAARELTEETGYRAGQIQPLLTMCMSPGILNECMHVFLATQLEAGSCDLQDGEQIETWLVTPRQAIELLQSNEIKDAKTVAALLYYLRFVAQQDDQ